MGWTALAPDMPLDGAQPPAQTQPDASATPTPVAAPATPEAAPAGFTPLPADVPLDHEPANPNAAPNSPAVGDPITVIAHRGPATTAPIGYTTHGDFVDTQERHASPLPPEVEQKIVHILANDPLDKAADNARAVLRPLGIFPGAASDPKYRDSFDQEIAYRRSHGTVSDSVINTLMTPEQAAKEEGVSLNAGAAGVRGAGDAPTAGLVTHIDSALHVAKDVLTGDDRGGIGNDFNHWEDVNQSILHSDEANHPYARLTGQIIGGMALPTGTEGVALEAGKSVLAAGGTMREARAAAAAAARNRIAAEGAGYGTVHGAASAEPGHRLEGAVEGAAEGGVGGYALAAAGQAAPKVVSAVGGAFSRTPPEEAVNTAQAANDLNIDLPAFAVQGPAEQAKAANLTRKGAFGATMLGKSAQTAIDQSQAARDEIAGKLAIPQAMDASLGGDIKNAAIDARTEDRSRIGRMFTSGDEQMAGVPVPLKQTSQALNDLVTEDGKAIVSSPVTPLIKQILQRVKDVGGSMSAADLRTSTQNLKSLMRANNIDSTTSDHVMGIVRNAMNADMEAAAKASGNDLALQTYKDAREQWAASKTLDKTVLKPILGAAFQNTGDQVINAIKSAVVNNGTRVAQLFSALPDDVANTARASLISRMGTPTNGGPEDFSLQELLKNYNKLGGARRLIFSPETNQALDKLAAVAERGKALETVAQNGAKAPAFGVKKLMTSGPAVMAEAVTMFTHDVKDLAVGTAISALGALGQWRSAKLLANPDFAKRLANMPTNPKAAQAFWNRPWVKTVAARNPGIAAEVEQFQKAVNDNFVRRAAASPDANGPSQNQQTNSAQPQ